MIVKSFVGLRYELTIESLLATTRLVGTNQENSVTPCVERESDAPDAAGRVEPQLLHVRVAGAIERINTWSAELRTELFQQFPMSAYLVLHVVRQRIELGIEVSV